MSDLEGFIRTALGEFGALLDDDQVVELSANPNGAVFVERLGLRPEYLGEMPEVARERIIRFCATASGIPVTDAAPIVSARMPGTGYRFEGVKPPACDAPSFSIRFHAARILSMQDYVAQGVVTPVQAEYLLEALSAHKNIVLVGGTGSGKTTFLNMLIGEMERASEQPERLIVIEDTPEIKTENLNTVFLKTTPNVDMTRLLASALRQRPDRIIVGEVRDGAALATLAMSLCCKTADIVVIDACPVVDNALLQVGLEALQITSVVATGMRGVIFFATQGLDELVQVVVQDDYPACNRCFSRLLTSSPRCCRKIVPMLAPKRSALTLPRHNRPRLCVW